MDNPHFLGISKILRKMYIFLNYLFRINIWFSITTTGWVFCLKNFKNSTGCFTMHLVDRSTEKKFFWLLLVTLKWNWETIDFLMQKVFFAFQIVDFFNGTPCIWKCTQYCAWCWMSTTWKCPSELQVGFGFDTINLLWNQNILTFVWIRKNWLSLNV